MDNSLTNNAFRHLRNFSFVPSDTPVLRPSAQRLSASPERKSADSPKFSVEKLSHPMFTLRQTYIGSKSGEGTNREVLMQRFDFNSILVDQGGGRMIFAWETASSETQRRFFQTLKALIITWSGKRHCRLSPDEIVNTRDTIWCRLRTQILSFGSVGEFIAYLKSSAKWLAIKPKVGLKAPAANLHDGFIPDDVRSKRRLAERGIRLKLVAGAVSDDHPVVEPLRRLESAECRRILWDAVSRLRPSHQRAIHQWLNDDPMDKAGYARRYRAFEALRSQLPREWEFEMGGQR